MTGRFGFVACLAALSLLMPRHVNADLYEDFATPPVAARPWCYWYWVNGNVDRETATADLEAMKRMGFGGVLMMDPRGYDRQVWKPPVKLAFASPEWYGMVAYCVKECARLGLTFTMNLSDCGGSLKGPWRTGEDGPKRLVCGVDVQDVPADYEQYHDICEMAVTVPSGAKVSVGWRNAGGATGRWEKDAEDEAIPVLPSGATGGRLVRLRFGYCAIPKREFDVDVIDPAAVERHFNRIVEPLCQVLGPLVGTTFTHVYSVSWEGAIPTWTPEMASEFRRRRGYDLLPFLPALAGFGRSDGVLKDFRRTRNDMFRENFYGTVRRLAHARGLKIYSENGGPWNRSPSVFLEADQLTALGLNDMPQGEFWPVPPAHHADLAHNVAAANAARIYGLKRASTEAFTTMDYHWNMLPCRLKRSADDAFVDGINHFVWHTFSCSPKEFGTPGIEYFAGTHINRNVTWHGQAHAFLAYLGRCQLMLQTGEPVTDLAIYAGPNAYRHWGRYRTLPFDGATIAIPRGYNYDILNDEKLGLKDRYAAYVDATGPGAAWPQLPPPDFEGDFNDVIHRRTQDGTDIYFVTTAGVKTGRGVETFRVSGKVCELWDPVTGNCRQATEAKPTEDGRTRLPLAFARDGSVFVVFRPQNLAKAARWGEVPSVMRHEPLKGTVDIVGPWIVDVGGREFNRLGDWTKSDDFEVRHFSGTAKYRASFTFDAAMRAASKGDRVLRLGHVEGGVAEVFVNGTDCGVVWCAPWYAKVPAAALRDGVNELEVRVTNTWRNRLIGDCLLPPERRVTRSCLEYKQAPHNNARGEWGFADITKGYSANDPLDSCGLYGPVSLR